MLYLLALIAYCAFGVICFFVLLYLGFNVWHVEMFGLVKLSDKECDNIDNTNVFLSALCDNR